MLSVSRKAVYYPERKKQIPELVIPNNLQIMLLEDEIKISSFRQHSVQLWLITGPFST